MLLRIRAWRGQLRPMWAKIQDTKSLCPATADIPPSQPRRAGVEQPSLHSAEDGHFHKGQVPQLRLATCPPHPRMGFGTNFTEPTATTEPREVPTSSPHRWNQSLPSSACPCEESELQSRPGDSGRAGGGQRGPHIKFNLLPTFCTAYKLRTDFILLNSWEKLKEYFVTRGIQMSTSTNKVVLAHGHAHWLVSCPQLLWYCSG